MTQEQQKEKLSEAFLKAVAATAGFSCAKPDPDDESVDLVLKHINRRTTVPFAQVDVQLKATATLPLVGRDISFPLPKNNYDDLRALGVAPKLLIVMLLPAHPGNWLHQSADELILRHAAYWLSLAGMPQSSNRASVTVQIPRQNLVTPASMLHLMARIHGGRRP